MNYPAMRWAVEECRLDGAAKPILFVIAYRAARDTGECWASQRRIAREAGVTRTHVQRVMAELVDIGVLEVVDQGSGTRANVVRIAPHLVEGEASASGIVEGVATASGVVEDEVIHNPFDSGHMTWPQASGAMELVATWPGATGHMEPPETPLVATSRDGSGHSHVPSTSRNAEKGFNQGFRTSRKEQVLDDASSAASPAGVVEAAAPHPSLLRELERRGLRRPSKPPRAKSTETPVRSREEQLAILERQIAEEEARKAQEGEATG